MATTQEVAVAATIQADAAVIPATRATAATPAAQTNLSVASLLWRKTSNRTSHVKAVNPLKVAAGAAIAVAGAAVAAAMKLCRVS